MPIFRKDEIAVLFAHIPKSGGSSITRMFRQSGYSVSHFDTRTGKGSLNRLYHCTPQHWHAELLEPMLRLDRMTVIFSFVRHPVARLQSEYLYRHRNKPEVDISAATVEGWANKAFTRWRRGEKYLYDNHMRPQSEFLLPGAVRMRVEDGIDAQLAELSSSYGLGLISDGERVKAADRYAAGHRSRDVEVSPALERSIRRFYRRDFRVLGYR